MDLHAWGRQRAQYSRARRGRDERGATITECALIQAVTQAMALRMPPRRPVLGERVEAAPPVSAPEASPAAA